MTKRERTSHKSEWYYGTSLEADQIVSLLLLLWNSQVRKRDTNIYQFVALEYCSPDTLYCWLVFGRRIVSLIRSVSIGILGEIEACLLSWRHYFKQQHQQQQPESVHESVFDSNTNLLCGILYCDWWAWRRVHKYNTNVSKNLFILLFPLPLFFFFIINVNCLCSGIIFVCAHQLKASALLFSIEMGTKSKIHQSLPSFLPQIENQTQEWEREKERKRGQLIPLKVILLN